MPCFVQNCISKLRTNKLKIDYYLDYTYWILFTANPGISLVKDTGV